MPSRTTAMATAVSKEINELALDKASAATTPASDEATTASPDNGNERRRRSSRRSTATSLRQTATTTSARRAAEKKDTEPAATPRLSTRGPDASGLDMDGTFADIDTNFGDHDLGDLDDDLDAFDGLDSSPTPAGGASGSANATHTADSTSSSFNVGLFRRGRPRQSSIHSRDDAPIRPSSRSGAATPSFGSTLNLGTFKRRAREPSILGHRRDASRHTSRDRDGETSGSEMDNGPYTSDADSTSMTGRMRRGRQASASRASAASRAAQAAHVAQSVADSSMASSSNTTSMLLMARTRTRGATTRKRKSEEGQREDELPKRRAVEEMEEPTTTAAAATLVPPSDTGVMESVEMPSSSPLSTPPRQASLPMSDANRRRYATPGGPDDEIMAPPMSSGSSSASPTMWPSLKGLVNAGRRGKATSTMPSIALSRQTPDLMDDDASDISSPPSLTHSPNYRSRAPSKAKGKAPGTRNAAAPKENIAPLTSAALAALLPQRHRRGRSNRRAGDDDDASDRDEGDNEFERSALLSEDDDELAHGPRRDGLRRGRSAARAPSATSATALRSISKAPAGNRASATKTSSTGKSKRAVRRTYGSRSFSDKENQDSTTVDLDADESTFTPLPDDAFGDDDTTTQVLPAQKTRYFGEELENAAKKFKEVDRWALEFEVVSRSSSPVGAR
ncbi:hypothetical protein SEUCBS139899_000571 [Sporothrix eucalyptigena]